MRLFRNHPDTPEGKFPICLRRDGTPVEDRFFVIFLKDPNAPAAIRAYADAARIHEMDPEFCADIEAMFEESVKAVYLFGAESDPDGAPHRKDDEKLLAWARSIGCPGS